MRCSSLATWSWLGDMQYFAGSRRLWQPPGTACLLPLIKAVHQNHAAHSGQQPLEDSLLSNCLASGIELQCSTSK